MRSPAGPLEAADVRALPGPVAIYPDQNRIPYRVWIWAISFSGWKDFAALLACLNSFKDHQQRNEIVAVVADGAIVDIMVKIANHFIHAQVRHFDLVREDTV